MKKTAKALPPIPCVYGCGKVAEGCLSLSFNEWTPEDTPRVYERGFHANLPCCRGCLKKAVTISVSIPKADT